MSRKDCHDEIDGEERVGTTTDLYYSAAWQVLEERIRGAAQAQYVWSPVYVDALVERDRDANGVPGDGLEERLYAQQDANHNVTALVDANGNVVERYVEDPYGQVTVLTAAWADRGVSLFAWVYLHQGGRFEQISALYHFRNRDFSPTLGRPVQRDPIEFGSRDVNLYRWEANRPISIVDPLGLAGQVVRIIGSDAIGFDLGILDVAISIPWTPILNITVVGGFQGLLNCQSDELAFYWYFGGGIGIGTPGWTVNVNAVFVWNLPNAATYTGVFFNLGGGATTGWLGFSVQGFTSNLLNPFKGVYGFEVGAKFGTPGGSGAFTVQYFGMVGQPIKLGPNNGLIRFFCCPAPNKPAQPQAQQIAQQLARGGLGAAFLMLLREAQSRVNHIRAGAEDKARDFLQAQAANGPLHARVLYQRAMNSYKPSTTIKWATALGEIVSL